MTAALPVVRSVRLDTASLFNRLIHLEPDSMHEGDNDQCVIGRSHVVIPYGGNDYLIYRGLTAFFIYNGCTVERVPANSRTFCFDPDADNDFRPRRFAALIMQRFGYEMVELATDKKIRAYLFPNVVRVGSRFAAYSYTGSTRVGQVVHGKRLLAYSDTPQDAREWYEVIWEYEYK